MTLPAKELERTRELFTSGMFLEEVGAVLGISKEAVRLRLKRLGVSRQQGGAAKRSIDNKLAEAKAFAEKWGLTKEERAAVKKTFGPKPFRAFSLQRTNAKRRGIAFNLRFGDWWRIWLASGKWNERGRCGDRMRYVMARKGDVGPYAEANVVIKTQSENMLEFNQQSASSRQAFPAHVKAAPK